MEPQGVRGEGLGGQRRSQKWIIVPIQSSSMYIDSGVHQKHTFTQKESVEVFFLILGVHEAKKG
jgi:hypothetical protein